MKIETEYEGEHFVSEFEAKHETAWYIKHGDRCKYLLEREGYIAKRRPSEWNVQAANEVQFMDRTGLVSSNNKSPILGLMHRYGRWNLYASDREGVLEFNPYCHRGGTLFDHTSAWRKQGERWPSLVITEPYHICDDEIQSRWVEATKRTNYKFKIFKPSKYSLWNKDTYMWFWWHSEYYQPDFSVLMPECEENE